MSTRSLPGINIQYPWSEFLVSGEKKVETRSYPLPAKFVGVEMAIIETPGKLGKKNGVSKARIIGTIVFTQSKKYESLREWKKDRPLHLVSEDDPVLAFNLNKPKYGWLVKSVTRLSRPLPPPTSRGIIFAKGCKV